MAKNHLSAEELKVLGFDFKHLKLKKLLNNECLSLKDIKIAIDLYGNLEGGR